MINHCELCHKEPLDKDNRYVFKMTLRKSGEKSFGNNEELYVLCKDCYEELSNKIGDVICDMRYDNEELVPDTENISIENTTVLVDNKASKSDIEDIKNDIIDVANGLYDKNLDRIINLGSDYSNFKREIINDIKNMSDKQYEINNMFIKCFISMILALSIVFILTVLKIFGVL